MTELTITDATEVAPATSGTAIEAAPEVVEGELVTEAEFRRATAGRRIVAALPAVWKDPEARREAGRELTVRAVRGTLVGYPLAVLRGAAVTGRVWRDWVTVAEVRESARKTEKLIDKWEDIRRVSIFRWKVTGGVAAPVALGAAPVALGWIAVPTPAAMIASAAASAVFALVGRRKDGSPGRKAILPGPRSLAWTMNGDALVDAFRAAGLIKRDEGLAFVNRPARDGDGWAVTIDLPPGRKASQAIARREELATALAVDETQLVLDRVRGKGGHAGRLAMWVADEDPYASASVRSPLAEADEWDFWRAVPFGLTARARGIDLPLLWTNLLVGAIPRMGKTYAARIPVTAAALDPYVRPIVFDGKGGKDWAPFAQVAHRFGRGDDDATCERLLATLREAVADVQARFTAISEMDDELCPESKVTPAITNNPAYGMPLTVIAIDEVQVYLEDDTPVCVGTDAKGNPRYLRRGQVIADLLAWLARKAPAAGYMLVLATQKPDSTTIPTKLRDQIGTRFALRMMTYQASDTILGAGTYAAGYDASKLLASHKGVGLLLGADGETDLDAGEATTVRTHMLTIADVRRACERGRELRIQAGTLTGDAAGDTATTGAVDPVLDAEVIDPLPEQLRAVVDYLAKDLDDDGRAFVPTSELLEELGLAGDSRAATRFGLSMGSWGCGPKQGYILDDTHPDGRRQVRGYRLAEIRAVVERIEAGGPVVVLTEATDAA